MQAHIRSKMVVRSSTLVLVCVFLLTARSAADEEENVYSFTVKDIQGKNVSLSDYKGKVSSLSVRTSIGFPVDL